MRAEGLTIDITETTVANETETQTQTGPYDVCFRSILLILARKLSGWFLSYTRSRSLLAFSLTRSLRRSWAVNQRSPNAKAVWGLMVKTTAAARYFAKGADGPHTKANA